MEELSRRSSAPWHALQGEGREDKQGREDATSEVGTEDDFPRMIGQRARRSSAPWLTLEGVAEDAGGGEHSTNDGQDAGRGLRGQGRPKVSDHCLPLSRSLSLPRDRFDLASIDFQAEWHTELLDILYKPRHRMVMAASKLFISFTVLTSALILTSYVLQHKSWNTRSRQWWFDAKDGVVLFPQLAAVLIVMGFIVLSSTSCPRDFVRDRHDALFVLVWWSVPGLSCRQ